MDDVETLFTWLKIFAWIAAIGSTAFPILYAFSPWYKSPLGRMLMLQAVAFALALDLTLLGFYGYPSSIVAGLWLSFFVFGLIAFATISLTVLLWRTNHLIPIRRQRKEDNERSL